MGNSDFANVTLVNKDDKQVRMIEGWDKGRIE